VPGRSAQNQECLFTHLQPHYPNAKIVHRLDMDTSGIMVLALNADVHRQLSRQFEMRQTQKTYHAVCAGRPSQTQGHINLPMRCDWERRPRQIVDFTWGKHAQTHWQMLQQFDDAFWVELTPITGRSHQLRVHMKTLGHPILGDNLYADRIALHQAPRLLLHAKSLTFTHPVTLQTLHIDQPADFWPHIH
jgi:tRNA pseudouridine32 synthase/23S rRNA pseudouridine746 synthase